MKSPRCSTSSVSWSSPRSSPATCETAYMLKSNGARAPRSGARDGGRPPEAALQGEASNHRQRRWLNARVVSVTEKAQCMRQVRVEKANESEPPMTCRKGLQRRRNRRLAPPPGKVWGITCLPPKRRPAYRRRELNSGSRVERGNLRSDAGAGQSGSERENPRGLKPRGAEYR